MLENDQVGDCVVAAYLHAVQLWQWAATRSLPAIEPGLAYGIWRQYHPEYVPAKPPVGANDPGRMGVVQSRFLDDLKSSGVFLTGDRAGARHLISWYAPVRDHSDHAIKTVISDCGVAYVGFKVPADWDPFPPGFIVPDVWDITDADGASQHTGHAIILTGWDDSGYDLVSWGRPYRMTYRFAARLIDEAYAVVDPLWTAGPGSGLFS